MSPPPLPPTAHRNYKRSAEDFPPTMSYASIDVEALKGRLASGQLAFDGHADALRFDRELGFADVGFAASRFTMEGDRQLVLDAILANFSTVEAFDRTVQVGCMHGEACMGCMGRPAWDDVDDAAPPHCGGLRRVWCRALVSSDTVAPDALSSSLAFLSPLPLIICGLSYTPVRV